MNLSSRSPLARGIFDCILFASLFMAPLPVSLLFAAAGVFLFEGFLEIVAVGVIADTLYGVPLHFLTIPALYSLSSAVFMIAGSFLRRHLKFYSSSFTS